MEYLVGLAVVLGLGYLIFGSKKTETVANDQPVAPYKVEPPVPAGDVAPQPEPVAEAPAKAKKAPAKKPAAKKPAAAKAPAKKATAKKAPAKKPAK